MAETQRILVVEDSKETSEMLRAYLEGEGYEVVTAAWGKAALDSTQEKLPDLVVLDIHLPDMDGYEVCRQLRAHRRTENIPVIFLTKRSERTDRLAGLELGAVDYITKPFDIHELRLRVRNALRRASLGTLVNPITGLPTDPLVDERLASLLRQEDWALLAVSIKGLRDFSDSYGFVASDDVLRAVALMIKDTAQELGDSDAFIGHLGESGFFIITVPSKVNGLRERIHERLDQAIEYFYPMLDRESQHSRISLVTGVVTPQDCPLNSPLDIKVAALKSQTEA